jgi:hypothetical protein
MFSLWNLNIRFQFSFRKYFNSRSDANRQHCCTRDNESASVMLDNCMVPHVEGLSHEIPVSRSCKIILSIAIISKNSRLC